MIMLIYKKNSNNEQHNVGSESLPKEISDICTREKVITQRKLLHQLSRSDIGRRNNIITKPPFLFLEAIVLFLLKINCS